MGKTSEKTTEKEIVNIKIDETGQPPFGRGYRYYVLGILMFVFSINVLDRQILAILMEPVRLELGLSDTQLGFLSGIAFAIFYATLGIPIARIADKTSRKGVIVICLVAWSARGFNSMVYSS